MKERDKEITDILNYIMTDIKDSQFKGATFRQLEEWYSKIKTAIDILEYNDKEQAINTETK